MKILAWFKKASQVRSVSVFGLTIIIPNELGGLTPHNSHGSQEMSLSRTPWPGNRDDREWNSTVQVHHSIRKASQGFISFIHGSAGVPKSARNSFCHWVFKEKSMGNQWVHHFQDDLVPDSAQTSLPKRATMTIETGRLI